MTWNDNNGNKKGGWDKKDSPPDLDEALRKLQKKLSSLLGGGPRGGQPAGTSGGGFAAWFFMFIALLIGGLWFISGIFILGPAEEAAVLRFGKYVDSYWPGGLHWVPRLIETPYVVNVERVEKYSYTSEMLNKDENIVSVTVSVQFRIDNLKDYLFNVVSPRLSLEQATASALRQVIGHSTLDEVLTFGREKVRQDVSEQLNKTLDIYHTGIKIMDVVLQAAKAPDQVKHAFDDAIKAQEDEQRFINQAEAYAAGVVPIARGQAKKLLRQADAYKKQVALQAKGDIAKYSAILVPYKKAPKVTRERMYLTTLEDVLNNTTKVFMDGKDGNNSLMYLPVEEMLKRSQQHAGGASGSAPIHLNKSPSHYSRQASHNASQSRRLDRDSYQGRRGRS